jgi:ABC-type polysaccharide/polyol phosphate export permease
MSTHIFSFINATYARADILLALKNYHLFLTLGWQDVATRYRRSRVGAFWLTINMIVMIFVLWIVFGTLFRAPVAEFLPSLAIGIMVWGLISGLINEGCGSFIAAQETILQIKMPLSTHILRVVWRNLIIFGHNFMILPIIFLAFTKSINYLSLLSVIGLILLLINIIWMVFILALICTRFRDFSQITQNLMQVMFYATPIIWHEKMLDGRFSQNVLNLNPFYHLLNIVREPLLGSLPTTLNWSVSIVMAIFGWIIALLFFNRFSNRIPYWL